MADEPTGESKIRKEDIDAVAERLQEWIPTLPEQEQLVLGWIMTRAAAAEDEDVQEYATRTEGGVPVSELMAEAVGLHEVSGFRPVQTIGPVKWTLRF